VLKEAQPCGNAIIVLERFYTQKELKRAIIGLSAQSNPLLELPSNNIQVQIHSICPLRVKVFPTTSPRVYEMKF
jgi:hypothetical protein